MRPPQTLPGVGAPAPASGWRGRRPQRDECRLPPVTALRCRPRDCPPGAEDPTPPVCPRLRGVPAYPQTQPGFHPGSRRYWGPGAGQPGSPLPHTAQAFSPAPHAPAATFSVPRLPLLAITAARGTVARFCPRARPRLGGPELFCLFWGLAHHRGSAPPPGVTGSVSSPGPGTGSPVSFCFRRPVGGGARACWGLMHVSPPPPLRPGAVTCLVP